MQAWPGTFGDSGDGGPALSASFDLIIGLATDPVGNLIVADGTLRSISREGIVHTISGAASLRYREYVQGLAGGIGAVAVDGSGNVYVGLLFGDVLRRITPNGAITDVAGNTNSTYVGDNGPALYALLSKAQDVAVDASGNLYIADYGNSRVRKVMPDGTITTVAGNGKSGFSGDAVRLPAPNWAGRRDWPSTLPAICSSPSI